MRSGYRPVTRAAVRRHSRTAATATAAATAAAPQAQQLHERTGDSEGGRRARFFFPWTLVFPVVFAVVGIRNVLGPAGPVRTVSVR